MVCRATVLCGMVATLLLIASGGCERAKRDEVDLQHWNELINHNLPRGSTRTEVEKFLDGHHIEHSYIEKSNFPGEENSEVAFIRNSDKDGIVRKEGVQLKFRFGTDQRLRSFESKEIFTGP